MKKMKRMICMSLVLVLVFGSTLSFAKTTNADTYIEGSIYINNNGELDIEDKLTSISVISNGNKIKGSMVGKSNYSFAAQYDKSTKIGDEYVGVFYVGKEAYDVEIIKNDYGLSGVYYNHEKQTHRTFAISTGTVNLNEAEVELKEVTRKIEILKIRESESELFNPLYGITSSGVNRTLFIENNGSWLDFPYILEFGEARGTLHYIARPDPDIDIYFTKLVAQLDCHSGFDSIDIVSNLPGYHGNIFNTPFTSDISYKTYNINRDISGNLTYTIKANISAKILIKNLPFVVTDTESKTIYY